MSKGRQPGGFTYLVSDEQLRAFSVLTPYERLMWLDEARRFVLMIITPEVAARQNRLRRGETINGRSEKK